MTGFGRCSASAGGRKITVEIKALNSKQLDLTLKMPPRYRAFEGEMRNRIVETAQRGKVEVVVTSESLADSPVALFNADLLGQYKKEVERIDALLGISDPEDWHSVLLRLPDVMKSEELEPGDAEAAGLAAALDGALKAMDSYRTDEGRKLYEFLSDKIRAIAALLPEVEKHEEGRVAKIKSRLYENLEKLADVDYDKGRLEQELIFYIEKLDISEEKQRLSTHLDYFLSTMEGEKGAPYTPNGKKLGFIAQEMGREINTLGSKSNNAEMQIVVVKMKDELEQIKEQVLNVL